MRKRVKNFLKTRKKLIIILSVVFVSLFLIMRAVGAGKKKEWEEAEVKKGDIQETIDTTGTIQAVLKKNLYFIPSGIVESINVKEGDEVAEGQVIASLDTTILQAQVKSSEGQVQSMNSSLSRSQDPNTINLQEEMLAMGGLDLDQARIDYDLNQKLNDSTLDQAGLSYDSATVAGDNLEKTYQNTKEETEQSIEISKEYEDTVPAESEDWAEEQTKMTEIAQDSQLDALEGQLDLQKIQTEQAAIEYEMAKLRAESADAQSQTMLSKAEKAYQLEELKLQQLKTGLAYDRGIYGGQLEQAQAGLEMAKYNLNKSQILAPFSGTIVDIPFEEGDMYTGGEMGGRPVLLVDMEKFKVETEVNELDIVKIFLGQKAKIEFDGLPDVSFEGEVTKISLNPAVKDGVVIYFVDVTFTKPDNVYLGMTANVELVIKEEKDTLFIPISVYELRDGEYFVKVKKEEGKVEEKKIEVGLQSDTDVQVLSGLEEGDILLY